MRIRSAPPLIIVLIVALLATGVSAMPIDNEHDTNSNDPDRRVSGEVLDPEQSLTATARSSTYIPGIDVASWQHPGGAPIDWAEVAGAGYRYVFVKATEGTRYINPWYVSDVAGASAADMSVGAYHYARPSLPVTNALAEARHFANTIGLQTGEATLPPVLDLEEVGGLTPSQLASWSQLFLDETERLTNRRPVLYTGAWFWNTYVGSTAFGSYPLWLANYTNGSAPTMMPVGWSDWTFWQWTSQGTVPGIVGDVDLNRFRGSLEYLHSLGRGAAQGHAPEGHLDLATSPNKGELRIRGWAVDRDIPIDPVSIHVYVDGVGVRNAKADEPRPDIATHWPAAGPDHGFDWTFTVAPGTRRVCVFAIDLPHTGGGNTLLGCRDVWVPDPASPFVDVLSTDAVLAAVLWGHSAGIASGWSDGTFRPTVTVSRGAAAAFLHRSVDSPEPVGGGADFSDVDLLNPFRTEIDWLWGATLATGYDDGTFRATAPVSRQAAVAFLWRLAGMPEAEHSGFSDVGSGHLFATPIAWAAAEGIVVGYEDGSFRPTEPVTRHAMVSFLKGFLEA